MLKRLANWGELWYNKGEVKGRRYLPRNRIREEEKNIDPVMKSLLARKFVCGFTGAPVTAEEKTLLPEAAHQASTKGGRHPAPRSTSPAIKDELSGSAATSLS